MSDNDKSLEELHPDIQLRHDIEAGKVTQDEVDEIWKATADLSPQTPITVRRAVLLMREVTQGKTPAEAMALNWPFFTQEVMRTCTEVQAALMRDESKFAHLVAGTETIVKEMQKVGTLARRFDELNNRLDAVDATLRRNRARPRSLIRWQRRKKGGDANDLQLSAVSSKRKIAATPLSVASGSGEEAIPEPDSGVLVMKDLSPLEATEGTPDPDHFANQARAFTIGSAWAKEPDARPFYTWRCPLVSCEYTYGSGITDPKITANFRCLEHNLPLV